MKYVKIWLECGDTDKYEEYYYVASDNADFDEIESAAADMFEEYRDRHVTIYDSCRCGWKYITKEEYYNA